MKKLIKKLFIFLIPVFLYFLPPSFVLWRSGENLNSINSLLASDKDYVIGYAYNQGNYRYMKWKALQLKSRQKVVALGSSRVLQFRKGMFNSTFYNAGYTITSINDFIPFISGIPLEKQPEYLILGLDQWMFNKNWDDLTTKRTITRWSESFTTIPSTKTIWKVWKDIFSNKISIGTSVQQKMGKTYWGLDAIVNNKGFRSDGSMDYASQIQKLLNNDKKANDYQYSDTYQRIKKGIKRFEFGKVAHSEALNSLDSLLHYCHKKEIKVIAFLPPFANSVISKMEETGKYNYLDSLFIHVKKICDKYENEIYDFSTMKKCDAKDDETIDGFHGGEVTYQKILIKMLSSGSQLKNVCDVQNLQKDLEKKKNRYSIYP